MSVCAYHSARVPVSLAVWYSVSGMGMMVSLVDFITVAEACLKASTGSIILTVYFDG